MKVLWLCNTLMEDVALQINEKLNKPESWITGLFNEVSSRDDIQIVYLFPASTSVEMNIEGTTYISYGEKDSLHYSEALKAYFIELLKRIKPEVIHIFGTEFPHTLAMMRAADFLDLREKTVIQLQGLVSMCAKHYSCYLPQRVVKGKTFRNFIKRDNISEQIRRFEKRGQFETASLQLACNVIGRTTWDRICTLRINPAISYFTCNETLRDSFYRSEWSRDRCQPHSIFVSQSNYPLKGFHIALEAFKDVVEVYPDAHLYTTGISPFQKSISKRLKRGMYLKYLGELIQEYHLENNVTFLGYLSEEKMLEQYLRSNVFVQSSSIENSPNSLGEAMYLGVPAISSHVGGVSSIFRDGIDGFMYPADEPYMLAHYIKRVFCEHDLVDELRMNARLHAREIHDRDNNIRRLLEIYERIRMR